jgi:hypothetical protein
MKFCNIIILIFLTITISCYSQNKLSEESRRIYYELEKTTQNGKDCPSFYSYTTEIDSLVKYATENDLLLLLKYDNPAIKAYAFSALIGKSYPMIFDLITFNIENNQKIENHSGDIIETELLIDYFIDQVNPKYIFQDKRDSLKLTKHDLIILDSLLLFRNIAKGSTYQDNMLLRLQPRKEYYNRVKFLAYSNNGSALVALSRFRNNDDLKLIKQTIFDDNNDYYAMLSIKEFPDSSLFSLLSKKHNEEIKKSSRFDYMMLKEMYQAIAEYKNDKAKELLLKTLNESTSNALYYHAVYVKLAIKKSASSIYNDLLDKIKLDKFQEKEVEYELEK